jgi:hypothetical protein
MKKPALNIPTVEEIDAKANKKTAGQMSSEYKMSMAVFFSGLGLVVAGIVAPPLIPALVVAGPALLEVGGTLMASAGVGYAVSRGLAKKQ